MFAGAPFGTRPFAVASAYSFTLTLSVASSLLAQATDSAGLTQACTLAVDQADHAQATVNILLSYAALLTTQEASHSQLLDNILLTQKSSIQVEDSTHLLTIEAPDVSPSLGLYVDAAQFVQTAEPVQLTQANIVAIADALHQHLSETPTAGAAFTLSSNNAAQTITNDDIISSINFVLRVSDPLMAQYISTVIDLTQAHVLITDDALHRQLADRWTIPATTPCDRVFVVAAEGRIFIVAPETRQFSVSGTCPG